MASGKWQDVDLENNYCFATQTFRCYENFGRFVFFLKL